MLKGNPGLNTELKQVLIINCVVSVSTDNACGLPKLLSVAHYLKDAAEIANQQSTYTPV